MILQRTTAGLSQATLQRFVTRARRAVRLQGRVNVLVASSGALRSLNLRFRGKNKATDVLSFPAAQAERSSGAAFAGEIAISADIAAQNAMRLGHSAAQEIKILTLHGILHLAGFDHERDNGAMARKEFDLRRKLRLPAGLIERAQARTPASPRSGATSSRGKR